MSLALILIPSILLYATVAGYAGGKFYRDRTAACKALQRRGSCGHLHEVDAFAFAATWAISLPVAIGFLTSGRAARRQIDEVAEAKRRADMAEHLAREERALGLWERP